MTFLSPITDGVRRGVTRIRGSSDVVDHGFRAVQRYLDCFGGRLAAGIAYYGFFATFALGLLAYSVLGFLVEYQLDFQTTVDEFLAENLPVLRTKEIADARGRASLIGLIALVLAGVAWVDALRSSQRLLWKLDQAPGNIVLRRAVDVVVLPVLALLLIGSFAVAAWIGGVLERLPPGGWVARPVGWLLTLSVNLLLALAVLAALPRLRISARRLLPPALAVALGLLGLNSLGRLYIERVQENPAYAVVATAAGLLVFLYLFHQLVLLAAAWAATAAHGRVVDLAFGNESDLPATPVRDATTPVRDATTP